MQIILRKAIKGSLSFSYQKVNRQEGKGAKFEVEPYKLVSKNGIWYLVALHDKKIKVFSVTRISQLVVLDKIFKADSKLQQQIASNESIYYEDTLSEVILKVNANVAVYFTRCPCSGIINQDS